jgi:hypothetical protein
MGAGEDRRRKMISTKLHPYMVFDGDDPEEGACLVFAHNAREARLIGFPTVSMWCDGEWIQCHSRRLWNHNFLFGEGDPEKLAANEPHCIESPKACKTCRLWGGQINGDMCSLCA